MSFLGNLATNPNSLPSSSAVSTGSNLPGTPPIFNWNGSLSEASITVNSGTYVSFGTISFPVSHIEASFSQDIVEHKMPNVPGARVESMGANPVIFKITSPLLFGLQRGSGEKWNNLYPSVFTQLLAVLNDQVSPDLTFTHSTMGQFSVKPRSVSAPLSTEIRNGQIIEFELIQNNIDNSNLTNVTTQTEFGLAQSAANLFDAQIVYLRPAPPSYITSISLSDLLQQVQGVIDSTTLYINQLTSSVNHALYQLDQIEASLDALDTSATSGLTMQLQRVRSGVLALVNNQSTVAPPSAATQLASSQTNTGTFNQVTSSGLSSIGIYIVKIDMTLANVALVVHNTADQLILLNPGISSSPTITAGTQIAFNNIGLPSSSGNAVISGSQSSA